MAKPARSPSDRLAENIDRSGGPDACWPWIGTLSPTGYGQLTVGSRSDGTRRNVLASRLALELHLGRQLFEGMEACHKPGICHNRACCNHAHLYEGTPVENQSDRLLDGTSNRGERSGAAKLNNGSVSAIRCLYALGVGTQTYLASLFGIHNSTVSVIVNRKTWA